MTVRRLPPTELSDRTVEIEYLCRQHQDETLAVPLPLDWSPQRVLRYWVLTSIAHRLKIPMPHWPITL